MPTQPEFVLPLPEKKESENYMAKILIIDDEEQLRKLLARIIALEGYEVAEAADCAGGLRMLRRYEPDVVLCDVKLPDGNGVEMVERIKQAMPSAEVILLTAYGNIPDGVQAIKNGAFDYITKGDDNNKILPLLSRATEKAQMQRRLARLEDKLSEEHSFDRIIGSSESLRSAVALARKVAVTDTSVLLTGETGTGKEVFAQAIHHASPRAKGAFVAVNCSAFSKELLESELFGHRAGSFTGATKDKKGLFEEADHGTLFLDEVGELPLPVQGAFLRALELRRFRPVGEVREVESDFRLVAATNRDLDDMVGMDLYRSDLRFRLRGMTIHVPPLRRRAEDIPLLAEHFTARYCQRHELPNKELTPDCYAMLADYSWPGNVRELQNLMHSIVITKDHGPLSVKDLPRHMTGNENEELFFPDDGINYERPLKDIMADIERGILRKALKVHGSVQKVAEVFKVNRSTIFRKLHSEKDGGE